MVNEVAELNIEHVLLFVIAAYLLYNLTSGCRGNGFSVGVQTNGRCECTEEKGLKNTKNRCQDQENPHAERHKTICTNQTTEKKCETAGGKSWIGQGTCKWVPAST
jgi:hypothetical protein